MLTKADYQSALDVQSAVNLSGVVFEFDEIMKRICAEAHAGGHGTTWTNYHPVARLYVESLAELCSAQGCDSYGSWVEAYDFCQRSAAGLHAHLAITIQGNEVVEYEVRGSDGY